MVSQVVHEAARQPKYTFVGFARPAEARHACGDGKHLAMPKTPDDLQALLGSMSTAQGEGYMSTTWPENTVWVGGHWHAATRQWLWDDGSDIQHLKWAPDEPSGGANQAQEPWLCMLLTGELCDSSSEGSFGVFCELEALPQEPWAAAPAVAGPAPAMDGGSADEVAEPEAEDNAGSSAILEDIAAAIEAKSSNAVQVHTPLPTLDSAPLGEMQQEVVMQKDAASHATTLLRLLQRVSPAHANRLAACVAALAAAITASVLLAAACRLPGQRARPRRSSWRGDARGCDREVPLTGISRPPVPYEQLPSLSDPAGVEAA